MHAGSARSPGWISTPIMATGTLAHNLRIARPDATDAELVAALRPRRASRSTRIVRSASTARHCRPANGDAPALARALLRGAPLLVLDEPTAGLDAATEADVLRAVRAEAARGVAVLMVSHRPTAIAAADRVESL